MKIIFLNTWFGQLSEEISKFMTANASDTDVFCLQEVHDEMKTICAQTLAHTYTEISAHKEPLSNKDHYGNYQATYIRKSIPILNTGFFFKDQADAGLGISTHIFLHGKDVHISNIHGIPQPGKFDTPGRIKQSQTIIDAYRKKSGLKIIGGDFNVLPETESVRMFEKEGYENLIAEYNISTTRNKIAWGKYPGNELYYSDYVFVSQDVPVTSFSVPNILISDHLPMILTIDA